jgi:hypothetical protein
MRDRRQMSVIGGKVPERQINICRESHANAPGTPDNIFWSISSTECGEMPSSPNPGIPGDDTVSICISST